MLDLKLLKDWHLCQLYMDWKEDKVEREFNCEGNPEYFNPNELDIVYKLFKHRH